MAHLLLQASPEGPLGSQAGPRVHGNSSGLCLTDTPIPTTIPVYSSWASEATATTLLWGPCSSRGDLAGPGDQPRTGSAENCPSPTASANLFHALILPAVMGCQHCGLQALLLPAEPQRGLRGLALMQGPGRPAHRRRGEGAGLSSTRLEPTGRGATESHGLTQQQPCAASAPHPAVPSLGGWAFPRVPAFCLCSGTGQSPRPASGVTFCPQDPALPSPTSHHLGSARCATSTPAV